jgi:hypothetical protein
MRVTESSDFVGTLESDALIRSFLNLRHYRQKLAISGFSVHSLSGCRGRWFRLTGTARLWSYCLANSGVVLFPMKAIVCLQIIQSFRKAEVS